MVPLDGVQIRLQQLTGAEEPVLVVAGLPDKKKGEGLIVLHKLEPAALSEFLKLLPQSGLPNLWIPKPNQFFAVKELPFLGSGKLDLRKLAEIAAGLARESEEDPKQIAAIPFASNNQ